MLDCLTQTMWGAHKAAHPAHPKLDRPLLSTTVMVGELPIKYPWCLARFRESLHVRRNTSQPILGGFPLFEFPLLYTGVPAFDFPRVSSRSSVNTLLGWREIPKLCKLEENFL